jgi:signal transduction histidine kinase/CheY-like chemotaxis protein
MLRTATIIIALVSTLLARPARANEAVLISNESLDAVDVTADVSYLTSAEPINHIIKSIPSFRPAPKRINLSGSTVPVWLTFEMESHATQTRQIYVEIPQQTFWSISMYVLRGNEITEKSTAGLGAPASKIRFLPNKTIFPVQIEPGERLRFFFNAELFGPIDFTTKLYDSASFGAQQTRDHLRLGAFYGIMITLLLLNLFFLVTTRDEVYVYHSLSIVTLSLFFSTLNGFGPALLWPSAAEYNISLMMMFASFYFPFQAQFLVSFLGNLNRSRDSFMIATAQVVSVVSFLAMTLHFSFGIFERSTIVYLLATIGTLMNLIGLFLAGVSFSRGFKPAGILLLSYSPFALVSILRNLAEFGIADHYFLQNELHQLATAGTVVLISMALANRVSYLKQRHRQVELEHDAITQKNKALVEQEGIILRDYETVLKTTQMLAHDVRKPFSLLRMGLDMLVHSKNSIDFDEVMSRLVPEVDSALESVNGMIADVMEIGTKTDQLNCAAECPETLIEEAVRQTFTIYPKANISIAYQIGHTSMVYVHAQKIGRGLANIYTNAIQAMGFQGHTWFRTRDILVKNRPYVEFCIGNSGSFVPEESTSKIFDAFFTSGKKNGTGLGLAITRKMVLAHGGQIWCESTKNGEFTNGKVEFYFTLPVAPGNPSTWKGELPRHSSQLLRSTPLSATELESVKAPESSTTPKTVGSDHLLSGTLESMITESTKSFSVLIIDDEPFYCAALSQYIYTSPGLTELALITEVSHSRDAINAVKTTDFDLIIMDIDLGPSSLSGFELVKTMRNINVNSFICIHSNRIVPADHKAALKAGADLFMPKPMARAQFLRLILEASQLRQQQETATTASGGEGIAGAIPEVLVIDDNAFVLHAWKKVLSKDATVHIMTGLDELQDMMNKDPNFLSRLSCIVTDWHFQGSSGDGLDIGRFIKKRRPGLRVFLSSDASFAEADLAGAVDAVIGKEPLTLGKLCA